jgi:carboxymethylenebutenolidase
MLVTTTFTDLITPTTPMRVHVYVRVGDGTYPGLLLYPEIFQQTGPIARLSVRRMTPTRC